MELSPFQKDIILNALIRYENSEKEAWSQHYLDIDSEGIIPEIEKNVEVIQSVIDLFSNPQIRISVDLPHN
jgi:hypothetical protein